jgi:hypothetical protein
METKFQIGQIVYLKTDTEQLPRIVTGILFRSKHCIYYLSQAINETRHYDYEISVEVNEIIKMLN